MEKHGTFPEKENALATELELAGGEMHLVVVTETNSHKRLYWCFKQIFAGAPISQRRSNQNFYTLICPIFLRDSQIEGSQKARNQVGNFRFVVSLILQSIANLMIRPLLLSDFWLIHSSFENLVNLLWSHRFKAFFLCVLVGSLTCVWFGILIFLFWS